MENIFVDVSYKLGIFFKRVNAGDTETIDQVFPLHKNSIPSVRKRSTVILFILPILFVSLSATLRVFFHTISCLDQCDTVLLRQ